MFESIVALRQAPEMKSLHSLYERSVTETIRGFKISSHISNNIFLFKVSASC